MPELIENTTALCGLLSLERKAMLFLHLLKGESRVK
jgi:hypothetical protein